VGTRRRVETDVSEECVDTAVELKSGREEESSREAVIARTVALSNEWR
jgi:hypothetical protein